MGRELLAQIPNLIFLVIVVVLARWMIRLIRLFFDAVDRGSVSLSGFEPDWAKPTYKIVRLVIIAFAVVVAYPYIPGSSTAAFKGVSLFAGVVLSLGSSSIISNLLAGFTMTYRRTFRVGDRVRIGDVVGDVLDIRLQVTHVRTPKNEEVVVPNSVILGSAVTNYSSLAGSRGLILHTTVGIGYETPWRQVEAMLVLAAERTPGMLREPAPFVLQRALGDFCITYELNAFCDRADRMAFLYAGLHRSILDVFNEYGVQIMTPAYEGDPEQPKVVPREQWYTAPAAPPPAEDHGSAG
jgi:small-conductance mechanosensitive channel